MSWPTRQGTLSICPKKLHQKLSLAVRERGVGRQEEVEHVLRCWQFRFQKLSTLLDQHVGDVLKDGVVLGSCSGEHQILRSDRQLLQCLCDFFTELSILVSKRGQFTIFTIYLVRMWIVTSLQDSASDKAVEDK